VLFLCIAVLQRHVTPVAARKIYFRFVPENAIFSASPDHASGNGDAKIRESCAVPRGGATTSVT